MAELELSEQLEELGIRNVSFAHGTIIALHGGVLLYSVGGSPSNLSAFCFTKGKALQKETNQRALVLHLIHQQGKGKSLDELKASAKQSVAVPTDMDGLVAQLKIFRGVLKIMLGKRNPASSGIKDLMDDIEDNCMEFESLTEADPLYPAKMLYCVDTRVQRYLGQCKRLNDREDVNENLVKFDDITENSLNQCFNITLPVAFQFMQDKGNENKNHVLLKSPGKKRKRKDGAPKDGATNRVQNTDQDDDFKMKPEESWKKHWAGKLNGDKPFWDKTKCEKNDCQMCPRFHIRGDCFDDCYNKESHVSKDKIPADRKHAMKEYMKKVRKN